MGNELGVCCSERPRGGQGKAPAIFGRLGGSGDWRTIESGLVAQLFAAAGSSARTAQTCELEPAWHSVADVRNGGSLLDKLTKKLSIASMRSSASSANGGTGDEREGKKEKAHPNQALLSGTSSCETVIAPGLRVSNTSQIEAKSQCMVILLHGLGTSDYGVGIWRADRSEKNGKRRESTGVGKSNENMTLVGCLFCEEKPAAAIQFQIPNLGLEVLAIATGKVIELFLVRCDGDLKTGLPLSLSSLLVIESSCDDSCSETIASLCYSTPVLVAGTDSGRIFAWELCSAFMIDEPGKPEIYPGNGDSLYKRQENQGGHMSKAQGSDQFPFRTSIFGSIQGLELDMEKRMKCTDQIFGSIITLYARPAPREDDSFGRDDDEMDVYQVFQGVDYRDTRAAYKRDIDILMTHSDGLVKVLRIVASKNGQEYVSVKSLVNMSARDTLGERFTGRMGEFLVTHAAIPPDRSNQYQSIQFSRAFSSHEPHPESYKHPESSREPLPLHAYSLLVLGFSVASDQSVEQSALSLWDMRKIKVEKDGEFQGQIGASGCLLRCIHLDNGEKMSALSFGPFLNGPILISTQYGDIRSINFRGDIIEERRSKQPGLVPNSAFIELNRGVWFVTNHPRAVLVV